MGRRRAGRQPDPAYRQPLPMKQRVRLGFDSAKTNDDNRRHWAAADALSADATLTPITRSTLRNRCRYEIANNSYARGIILTLAHDVVGTGPRLQLLTQDVEYNKRAELAFSEWASMVNLAVKLRTLRMARAQDGEGFLHLFLNPGLDHPVPIDLLPVEADRVCFPGLTDKPQEEAADGVLLDEYDNPVAYTVLRNHPGDGEAGKGYGNEAIRIEAREMIHYFRPERPGQHRGVPEITPALPLFAQLRRFTLAVLSAAEAAADFAGILYTDTPPGGDTQPIEMMDKISLQRNMLVTMPGGWKMSQIDPQQPASTYAEVKREILNEIARCLNMPFNVAAGNSSGYNYASGRLDHQSYFKSIRVEQHTLGSTVLDHILRYWLDFYDVKPGDGPSPSCQANGCRLPPHQWFWDGMEHVDPLKEANALAVRLSCGATSFAAEFGRQGKDFGMEMKNQAAALGITLPEYQALLRQKLFGPVPLAVVERDSSGHERMEPDYE
jgi:lambda family phage portal protein